MHLFFNTQFNLSCSSRTDSEKCRPSKCMHNQSFFVSNTRIYYQYQTTEWCSEGNIFWSLPDGDRLTRMQLKQQSLEQCGQRRASLSFSMQMKQRNTSAMLCTETEERWLGSIWHYSRKNHHNLHTVYTVTNWPWCLCLTTKISHTHIPLISPWNNLI